jgi:hypothetical protein
MRLFRQLQKDLRQQMITHLAEKSLGPGIKDGGDKLEVKELT